MIMEQYSLVLWNTGYWAKFLLAVIPNYIPILELEMIKTVDNQHKRCRT